MAGAKFIFIGIVFLLLGIEKIALAQGVLSWPQRKESAFSAFAQRAAIVRTQVYNLAGHKILEERSEVIASPADWIKNNRIVPGVYLYMMTILSWDGKVYRHHVSKILLK
jgi:hypothetical protein